jgi:hypothetical protein
MSFLANLWDGMGRRIYVSWKWNIGSGYTRPMRNLPVLMDAICEAYDQVWIDPKPFAPRNGSTFCNQAVAYVAHKFGYERFNGKLANEMVDILSNDKSWHRVTPQEAAERAAEGRLVIAARRDAPHGHVAIVRPGTLESSPKWQTKAPKLLNIGKDCFISKGANFAFREPPDYFSLEG